jgi:hypothetical protein
MSGCTPLAAAERVGLIFSLCGKAQRIAAEAACEAALGIEQNSELNAQRTQRVLIELGQEHAWHFLFHWPQHLGRSPDMTRLLALRKAAPDPPRFIDVLNSLLAHNLPSFDARCKQAATLPASLFSTWKNEVDQGISLTALLPPLKQWDAFQCQELAHRALEDENFCGQPEWLGSPAETGVISRQQTHPLLIDWIAHHGRGVSARLLARLLELAELPSRLHVNAKVSIKTYALAGHIGLSAIETSRGLLIHIVRLSEGKVVDYRIIAPTEWNFHPAGSLARALANLPYSDDIQARAQAICLSFDPCVAFEIKVKNRG